VHISARPNPLPSIISATLLATTCLTACAHNETASNRARSTTATSPRQLTGTEALMLHDATQMLVRDCMRRHGFLFYIVRPTQVRGYRFSPYVIDNVRWARHHGYGADIERQVALQRRSDHNARYFNSLPPRRKTAALAALNGPRPQGLEVTLPGGQAVVSKSDRSCTSDAERALYGDLEAWFRASTLTANLSVLRRSLVVVDPAFTAAVTAWRGCMRERGYAYSDPNQTRAEMTSHTRIDLARAVHVAVAEATCATATGFSTTAHRLDRRYGKAVRHQYRSVLSQARRLQLAALPQARSIVDKPSTRPTKTTSTPRAVRALGHQSRGSR
jgi:hypothetical protein